MRVQKDVPVYDMTMHHIGILLKTYGVNVLEIGELYVKVFSPDLNKNVLIRKEDLAPSGADNLEGGDNDVY